MRRRQFITLLSGAAAAWPLAARAQQPIPVIGFLNGASPTELGSRVVAFRDGLADKGYVEGHSVAIEYRWGLGQYERLPELAVDLVRHRVAVIAATGGVPSVRAAKAATSAIPIVFTMGSDPVAFGLVASLNRPGSNVTGITLISSEIASKRIALLRDLLPGAKMLGVLMNSATPASEAEVAVAERAAHTLGWQVKLLSVGRELDFDAAFQPLARERVVPTPIRRSSSPESWSPCDPTFWSAIRRPRLPLSYTKRIRFQSCLWACQIRSVAVSSRALRGPAATSPGSRISSHRSPGNGLNSSRKWCLVSRGSR
jgi:ABC-type uncharacterized transport system substrate-binding protein